MGDFDALTLAIEGRLDRPFSDLPDALRLRVEKDLWPLQWDDLSPEQRRSAALQLDYQHDPATERAREAWSEFFHRVGELQAELERQDLNRRGNLGELLDGSGPLKDARDRVRRMKARERHAKDSYYPQRRVPARDVVPGKYLAYPKALHRLRQRLGSTPEELAAWVWLGPEAGGLPAYLSVNEWDPPPRFDFGALPFFGSGSDEDADYLAPLMGCWFSADDVTSFQPSHRFITGKALIDRWNSIPDLRVEPFVRAKIQESRLLDLHPIYGGTQARSPGDSHLPPMAERLFRLADVEAIEAEELSPVDSRASEPNSVPPEAALPAPGEEVPLQSEVGSPDWRKRNARAAANAKHDKPGGSRDKQRRIREIWAGGKYTSRDRCAEEECAALGMSLTSARKALRNQPEPQRVSKG